MITRSIDVFDPSVVTVGRITAGTTNNVIPETAEIEGTIRAVERTHASQGPRRHPAGRRRDRGRARMWLRGDIDIGYPVTTQRRPFAEFALGMAARRRRRRPRRRLPHPVMGAEDFSYLLQNVPGAMMFLGGTPVGRNRQTAAPNHSNRVYFDEAAMTSASRSTPPPPCDTSARPDTLACLTPVGFSCR